jgi:hypothetical protein
MVPAVLVRPAEDCARVGARTAPSTLLRWGRGDFLVAAAVAYDWKVWAPFGVLRGA